MHKIEVVLRDPGDRRQRHVWSCSCGRSSELRWFASRGQAESDARHHTR